MTLYIVFTLISPHPLLFSILLFYLLALANKTPIKSRQFTNNISLFYLIIISSLQTSNANFYTFCIEFIIFFCIELLAYREPAVKALYAIM